VGDFAVAQQPIISILPEGTSLNVAAVASNDRRHVTLSLNPFFSQVTGVSEFTFDGTRRVVRSNGNLLSDLSNLLDNDPTNDNNIPLEVEQQGVTIQLPNFAFTTVNTVVQVPDGGSVLMGGLKRMSEARTERGVPFLSNIPYVNRLFKNVGIGRQTSNLMMMVTPRIIIQEEEEQIQVGNTGRN
jgi:general secretion pathway protein D